MTLRFRYLSAVVPIGVVCTVSHSHAQSTYTRQNNTTLLNVAGAWSAGGPPTSVDIALWNSTAASNLGTNLGNSVFWGQLAVTNVTGGVTIGNTAGAVLNLNGVAGVGIDMSSAANNLTINNTVTLGGSQSWNVASGRTLTVGGYNINTTGTTLTKTGAGTLAINSSTFTSSSGNLAINGGRVLYAGGNSLPSGNLSMNGGHLEDYFQGTGFSRTLGTGAGAVQITGGTSGFSESGSSGYWSVSLGTSIQWNNGAGTFNPTEFLLGGSAAQAQTNSGGGTLRNGGVTFSSNIDLNGGNRTIRVDQQDGGASGALDSAIAGNGAIVTGNLTNSTGTGSLVKTGVGRLILNPGTGNTYTGGTTINQGTVRFMKLAAMPASGAVSVQAGSILGVSVGAAGAWTTTTGTGNGTIGGLIAGNGGQAGGTVSWAAGNVGLDLNVATTQSYTGDIANPSGATLTVYKTGTGTLTLSGNSSYTGQTVILGGDQGTAGGVLAVGTLADAGNNSPIGAYATAGAGGLSIRNGTFRYTGGTATTNRGFSLDYAGLSSSIDVTGTSGTVLTMGAFAINAYNQTRFSITGTAGNSLVLGNGALNKQLYLTTNIPLTTGTLSLVGAQTIDNNGSAALTIGGVTGTNTNLTFNTTSDTTVTGQITTGNGTLTKNANSVLTLSGNNTYTGQTTATAGVLRLNHATALPGGIAASGGTSNLRINGGVVGLTANSGNFARAVGTGAAQVSWAASGGFAAYGGTRNVLLSASSINWTATSFIGTANTLILSHATADGTLNWQQDISTAGAARTVQVDNGSANIDAIMSGVIAGGTSGNANGFTKTGTGTLALTGSNTYWGPTTISTGTLMMGDGTGNTGNLSSNGTGISIATNAVLAVNRTAVVSQGTNSSFGDAVAITGGGSILIIGGNSGTGGAGLNQANTFTGGVTLQSGTLRIGSNGVAGTSGPLGNGGTLTINGGTIDTSSATARVVANVNPIVVNSNFAFTGTGDLTLPGTVDLGGTTRTITTDGSMLTLTGVVSNGGITKSGGGSLALTNANIYAGATIISAGVLQLGNGTTTGSLNSTTGGITNNGNLTINRSNPFSQATDLNGQAISGNGSFTQAGGGTTTLTSSNSYSGTTTISAGTLILANSGGNTLADNGAVVVNGGALELSHNETIGSLAGVGGTLVQLNNRHLIVGNASSTGYGGVIDGNATSQFTKQGAGTLTLDGANTYTGATTVVAGVLAVNGSLANTTTTVTGGTLRGSGSIGGSVTIQSGGTLAAGNSIESLGTGALDFQTGSTFDYELQTNLYAGTPNVAGDLTDSTGTLDIASGAILNLTDLATSTVLANNSKLTLISYNVGGTAGLGWNGGLFTWNLATLADGATFVWGANTWQFDYNDTTGGPNYSADQSGAMSFVTMTVVPEPRAALLGGIGLLLLFRRRR